MNLDPKVEKSLRKFHGTGQSAEEIAVSMNAAKPKLTTTTGKKFTRANVTWTLGPKGLGLFGGKRKARKVPRKVARKNGVSGLATKRSQNKIVRAVDQLLGALGNPSGTVEIDTANAQIHYVEMNTRTVELGAGA